MQVNTGVIADRGQIVGLMLFSRRSAGVTGPIKRMWLKRGVHWSAPSFRLLLFMRLCGGGTSVLNIKAWTGRSSMPMCYVKVSEGYVCRYGRGKGTMACYRLTPKGEALVDDSLAIFNELVAKELRGLPKKARLNTNI
jgi:hypothetical protein